MIMLLEQSQMEHYHLLHLLFAFSLLTTLLHQSILFLAQLRTLGLPASVSRNGFMRVFLWWTSRVPPPSPACLFFVSQRPWQSLFITVYHLFVW